MTFFLRDSEEINFQASVPRAVAEMVLHFFIQSMENADSGVLSGLSKSSLGLFIGSVPASFEPFLELVGLRKQDRILAVNGIALNSADAAATILNNLKTLLDSVKAGQGGELTYDVERRLFRVRVTVSVE